MWLLIIAVALGCLVIFNVVIARHRQKRQLALVAELRQLLADDKAYSAGTATLQTQVIEFLQGGRTDEAAATLLLVQHRQRMAGLEDHYDEDC